jgi:hypothetical protein
MEYTACPYCGNSTQAISVEIKEINGVKVDAIVCTSCHKVITFLPNFDDLKKEIIDLKNKIEDIESSVSNIESNQ